MEARILYGAALAVMAVLFILAGQEPPTITPGEAGRFEGQRIRVEGLAGDVHPDVGGGGRFTLVRDGESLYVRSEAETPQNGGWVSAEGRLVRSAGRLTLYADTVAAVSAPEPEEPGWAAVAAEPDEWHGRIIRLAGSLEKGLWSDRGNSIAIGEGPWPDEGKVAAVGSIAYDAACLCHRFHALEVSPWIP